MDHSPYLDNDRDLDELLKLVREYDAECRAVYRRIETVRTRDLMSGHAEGMNEQRSVAVGDTRTPYRR